MRTMPKPKIDPSKHVPFMTTEHFTLQAGRGIINAEIVARVNLYFLTLSSLVVALAFLAQLGQMNQVLVLFALVAFPALFILGLTTFTRLIQLGFTDFAYMRAINRVRHFYSDHAQRSKNIYSCRRTMTISPLRFMAVTGKTNCNTFCRWVSLCWWLIAWSPLP